MRCPAAILACAVLGAGLYATEYRAGAFGAKGDATSIDTPAIQKAIDAAATAGGGTVTFAPGIYLSGALFLKTGTHLRVDAGVEIRGVPDTAAYPEMFTRIAGIEMRWPAALINVIEQSKVKISGKGTIDGNGKVWWDRYWTMRRDYEAKGLRWAVDYDCKRVRLIQVYKSHNVELEGLTLKRPGFWTVHICYSDRVGIDGLIIRNNSEARGPSTDGIDVDSSSNVRISHCDIECNDDAICLKAGRDADGLRVNRPTEKVIVRDCVIRSGAAGITIGSETSGGIRDVDVAGLKVMKPVPSGIIFKSARTRGGVVERIVIRDLEMEGVATPININMNWNPSYSYSTLPAGMEDVPEHWKALTRPVSPEQGMPHFRNVSISGIKAVGATRAFSVSGYPEAPLEDFHFKDIDIEARSAGTIQNAVRWTYSNVNLKTADGTSLPPGK